jgi:hypothetical protein
MPAQIEVADGHLGLHPNLRGTWLTVYDGRPVEDLEDAIATVVPARARAAALGPNRHSAVAARG